MTDNLPVRGSSTRSEMCPVCGHNGPNELVQAPDRFHGATTIYRLVKCPSCSLVWLSDPPPPDQMGAHYGADYDRSISRAGDSLDRWTERVAVIRQHKTGGSLLDLGCSNGGLLQAMRSPSWNLFGIEMSDSVATQAARATGAQVFIGDILDAPYPPESFDVVTCFHVFEHLYHPREVLAKVANWLKPGGIFYAMMPNIHSAGARVFGSYWYALELPRHLYHFSPLALKRLAESVGLEAASIETHRELFVESSMRYCLDAAMRKIGVKRIPLAQAEEPGIPFKIVRKGFRWTALPVLNVLATFIGDGESIHVILRKPGLETVTETHGDH
jgi:SAM-dependent methyltransferase